MTKYTEQYKLKLVEQYLEGEAGFTAISRQHGVPRSLLRRWVAFFRLHGMAGLISKSVQYSPEFKLSVLQHMWENGLSLGKVSAIFDIRDQCAVGKWERSYRADGLAGLGAIPPPNFEDMPTKTKYKKPDPSVPDTEKSRDDLLAEINWMRMENAYLKKLDALIQSKQAAQQSKRK